MRRITSLLAAACVAIAAAAAQPSGTLPVMHIATQDGAPIISKDAYLDATFYIDNLGLPGVEPTGSPTQPLPLKIKGRGNYTWSAFEKKPYRLKLGEKADLLGLGKNKHFALLAHADDNCGFLRNTMGFWISQALGMPWTPEQQPVEVVLNGDYIGLYFLTTTIRVDKNRVDIDEQPDLAVDPETITGGWLVEIDNYRDDPHIVVPEGDGADIVFTYKSPEQLSPEQQQYLSAQMSAINSEVYADDKQACRWAEHVDLQTLAKFYITQEVMDNYESFHGSCYLCKQRGEQNKWMFGPVWDFGSSFNYDKSQYIYQGREHHQTWIGQMCQFPAFMDVVKPIWREFYASQYYPMLEYAQAFADRIAQAAAADAKRWPQYGNADEQAACDRAKRRLRLACQWLAGQWGGEPEHPEEDAVTVYFVNDSQNPWQEVYAYSWDDTPSGQFYELFGRWPGSKMEPIMLGSQAAFAITKVPAIGLSSRPGLIFDNGHSGSGNQTADLTLHNGHVYYADGSHRPADALPSPCAEGIKARPLPGAVEITSPSPATIAIVSIDGRRVSAAVPAGATAIPLPPGLYLVAGKKIPIQ